MQIKGSTFTYDTLPKDVQKKQNCYTFKKFVNVTCNQPIQGLQNWEARPSAMGERYYKYADRIRRFRVRDDDVWIISYPKCGTTWTQEMVWLLGNELDYATGAKVDLSDRSPFLEYVYYSLICVCVCVVPINRLCISSTRLLWYNNQIIEPQIDSVCVRNLDV